MPETLDLPSQPPQKPASTPMGENDGTRSKTGPSGEKFSEQSLDQGWGLGGDAFSYICSLAANHTYRSRHGSLTMVIGEMYLYNLNECCTCQ